MSMKIFSLVKKCYKILTFIVIVLYIIQGRYFHTNLTKEITLYLIPPFPFYILAFSWLYITGIMIAVKSISCFKEKQILLGIVLSIISLLFLIFSYDIVVFLFVIIYPNV
jgi:hypothetical protein